MMMLSLEEVMRYRHSMPIADDLRHFIESSGLSRYEIARRSGVTQGTLSKLMAGTDVTTRTIDALAPVLGLRLVADGRAAQPKATKTKRSTPRKAGR